MSQLVRLEGKHTAQTVHCALVTLVSEYPVCHMIQHMVGARALYVDGIQLFQAVRPSLQIWRGQAAILLPEDVSVQGSERDDLGGGRVQLSGQSWCFLLRSLEEWRSCRRGRESGEDAQRGEESLLGWMIVLGHFSSGGEKFCFWFWWGGDGDPEAVRSSERLIASNLYGITIESVFLKLEEALFFVEKVLTWNPVTPCWIFTGDGVTNFRWPFPYVYNCWVRQNSDTMQGIVPIFYRNIKPGSLV